MFFLWWPTYHVKGTRGKTADNKSPSIRTIRKWYHIYQDAAVFIYLSRFEEFNVFPIWTDDRDLGRTLRRLANDTESLRRFFGAYAYVSEALQEADNWKPFVAVPPSVPRVRIETRSFSASELKTIAEYSDNYLKMNK